MIIRTLAKMAGWIWGIAKRIPLIPRKMEEQDVLSDTRAVVRDAILRCFTRAESPTGQPWAPLKYRVGRPLILTGVMMREVLAASERARPTRNGLTVDIHTPFYTRYQNFGTRTIPARPFVGMSNGDKDKLANNVAGLIVSYVMSQGKPG